MSQRFAVSNATQAQSYEAATSTSKKKGGTLRVRRNERDAGETRVGSAEEVRGDQPVGEDVFVDRPLVAVDAGPGARPRAPDAGRELAEVDPLVLQPAPARRGTLGARLSRVFGHPVAAFARELVVGLARFDLPRPLLLIPHSPFRVLTFHDEVGAVDARLRPLGERDGRREGERDDDRRHLWVRGVWISGDRRDVFKVLVFCGEREREMQDTFNNLKNNRARIGMRAPAPSPPGRRPVPGLSPGVVPPPPPGGWPPLRRGLVGRPARPPRRGAARHRAPWRRDLRGATWPACGQS